jgi:hypothetical protein
MKLRSAVRIHRELLGVARAARTRTGPQGHALWAWLSLDWERIFAIWRTRLKSYRRCFIDRRLVVLGWNRFGDGKPGEHECFIPTCVRSTWAADFMSRPHRDRIDERGLSPPLGSRPFSQPRRRCAACPIGPVAGQSVVAVRWAFRQHIATRWVSWSANGREICAE